MEPSKKNTPSPLVIVAIALIALMIIFYFIITAFFPDLLQSMNTGSVQPVQD
ncbi:hypothetical protein [Chryseobacterium sp.]|uniref:hypothetical protein n=1 Tax=Chryseobacterium sp. TaxID=1871047 RepID=UPI001623A39D|nr:hypothetical protein [Chryseobacterium sp.]